MKKLIIIINLILMSFIVLFAEENQHTAVVGGTTNDITWGYFVNPNAKDPSVILNDDLSLDYDSNQVAENSISGIGNKTIAQAHGALLYSTGKENSEVWDLVSLNSNGSFEFFKNTWTASGGLSWKSAGTYNPKVSNFNGYGTGITGDFDNDGTVDYFGISETDRKNGKALYVTDVINKKNSRTKYVKSVKKDSRTFINTRGNRVNGTNGWTSTGIGKYDMNDDGFLDLVYAVRGSMFVIENHNGKFIGNGKLYNHVLFDDSILNNNDSVGSSSRGAAVCDIYDFNKDGLPDIIAGHTDKKGLYLYLGKEDENSKYPLYTPSEKIPIIGSNGKLTDNSTGSLISGGENKLAISLLRVDENGVIYIATDNFRQNGNGGKIMMIELDTDKSTSEKPFFNCKPILDNNSNDFDHGSLGKFYPDKKDQMVIADGNNSNQFYVTKTAYQNYYKSKGKMVSNPLTEIDTLGVKDQFIKKVGIEIKVSAEFFKDQMIEVQKIDQNGNSYTVKEPKASLYVNVFPERQKKNIGKHFLEDLYSNSYHIPIEAVKEVDGEYIISLDFEFDPVPYPVVSLAFKTNDAIQDPGFTPKILDMKLTVETGEPGLVITNITW